VADVLAAIGGTSGNPAKYDLEVEDLNNFCPLVPGFDEFDTRTDSRSNGKACYKYHWTPDPCSYIFSTQFPQNCVKEISYFLIHFHIFTAMEKSGRTESDLLHCGHYSMIPCVELNSGMNGLMEGLSGYDLPWDEVNGLCDVVNIKDRTTKKRRNIKPMYWKWTFCGKYLMNSPCQGQMSIGT